MVLSKSDLKRRRKNNDDFMDTLTESPKRTKVHAQRKFAQSSNVSSPVITPIKEIEKAKPPEPLPPPPEFLPNTPRPNTEDFLTFLCFRGTSILPPSLNFFNTASTVSVATQSKQSCSKSNEKSEQTTTTTDKNERPFIEFGVRKRADPIINNKLEKKRRQAMVLHSLRRKYQEQHIAKLRAHAIEKMGGAVKIKKTIIRTRSNAKVQTQTKTAPKIVTKRIVQTSTSTVKVNVNVKRSLMKPKMCLRSRGRFIHRELTGPKRPKLKKPIKMTRSKSPVPEETDSDSAEIESEFSSDDDEPLVKTLKSNKKLVKKVVSTKNEPIRITRSTPVLKRKVILKRATQIQKSAENTKSRESQSESTTESKTKPGEPKSKLLDSKELINSKKLQDLKKSQNLKKEQDLKKGQVLKKPQDSKKEQDLNKSQDLKKTQDSKSKVLELKTRSQDQKLKSLNSKTSKNLVTKSSKPLVENQISQRPSRKTKEAASLYMNLLGPKLTTSPAVSDDDSIDSFPELPNVRKTEQRELEMKAKLSSSSHSNANTSLGRTTRRGSLLEPKNDTESTQEGKKVPKTTRVTPKESTLSKELKMLTRDSKTATRESKTRSKEPKMVPKEPKPNSEESEIESEEPNSTVKSKTVSKTRSKEPKTVPKDPKLDSEESEIESEEPNSTVKSKTVSKTRSKEPKMVPKDPKPNSEESEIESEEPNSTVKSKTVSKTRSKEPKMVPKDPKPNSEESEIESEEPNSTVKSKTVSKTRPKEPKVVPKEPKPNSEESEIESEEPNWTVKSKTVSKTRSKEPKVVPKEPKPNSEESEIESEEPNSTVKSKTVSKTRSKEPKMAPKDPKLDSEESEMESDNPNITAKSKISSKLMIRDSKTRSKEPKIGPKASKPDSEESEIESDGADITPKSKKVLKDSKLVSTRSKTRSMGPKIGTKEPQRDSEESEIESDEPKSKIGSNKPKSGTKDNKMGSKSSTREVKTRSKESKMGLKESKLDSEESEMELDEVDITPKSKMGQNPKAPKMGSKQDSKGSKVPKMVAKESDLVSEESEMESDDPDSKMKPNESKLGPKGTKMAPQEVIGSKKGQNETVKKVKNDHVALKKSDKDSDVEKETLKKGVAIKKSTENQKIVKKVTKIEDPMEGTSKMESNVKTTENSEEKKDLRSKRIICTQRILKEPLREPEMLKILKKIDNFSDSDEEPLVKLKNNTNTKKTSKRDVKSPETMKTRSQKPREELLPFPLSDDEEKAFRGFKKSEKPIISPHAILQKSLSFTESEILSPASSILSKTALKDLNEHGPTTSNFTPKTKKVFEKITERAKKALEKSSSEKMVVTSKKVLDNSKIDNPVSSIGHSVKPENTKNSEKTLESSKKVPGDQKNTENVLEKPQIDFTSTLGSKSLKTGLLSPKTLQNPKVLEKSKMFESSKVHENSKTHESSKVLDNLKNALENSEVLQNPQKVLEMSQKLSDNSKKELGGPSTSKKISNLPETTKKIIGKTSKFSKVLDTSKNTNIEKVQSADLLCKDLGRRFGKGKVNMSTEQIEKWLNDSAKEMEQKSSPIKIDLQEKSSSSKTEHLDEKSLELEQNVKIDFKIEQEKSSTPIKSATPELKSPDLMDTEDNIPLKFLKSTLQAQNLFKSTKEQKVLLDLPLSSYGTQNSPSIGESQSTPESQKRGLEPLKTSFQAQNSGNLEKSALDPQKSYGLQTNSLDLQKGLGIQKGTDLQKSSLDSEKSFNFQRSSDLQKSSSNTQKSSLDSQKCSDLQKNCIDLQKSSLNPQRTSDFQKTSSNLQKSILDPDLQKSSEPQKTTSDPPKPQEPPKPAPKVPFENLKSAFEAQRSAYESQKSLELQKSIAAFAQKSGLFQKAALKRNQNLKAKANQIKPKMNQLKPLGKRSPEVEQVKAVVTGATNLEVQIKEDDTVKIETSKSDTKIDTPKQEEFKSEKCISSIERKSFFQKRHSQTFVKNETATNTKAFSPNNESSVYAFEDQNEFEMPLNTPFRSQFRRNSNLTSKSEEDISKLETICSTNENLTPKSETPFCKNENQNLFKNENQISKSENQCPKSENQCSKSENQNIKTEIQVSNQNSEIKTECSEIVSKGDVTCSEKVEGVSLTLSPDENNSASIAVQVNLDPLDESNVSLECSTQTDESGGQIFYIPLQKQTQSIIQGVAVKLGTEGNNQRVVMHAKLVTQNPNENKLPTISQKPLAQGVHMCPPIGTVQPTYRSKNTTETKSKSVETKLETTPEPPKTVPSSPSASSSSSTNQKITKRVAKIRKNLIPCSPSNKSEFPALESPGKLVEALVFRPTEQEFNDPIEFIEKIRPQAEKFGICRIIPPSNFKPECKVSDDMRFTSYNQYVHKMLHRWGPNFKELCAIKKYLATQSINLTHPPWIGGMEIDLPRLYQTVQSLGGLKEVIEKKRWPRVAEGMKIPKSAQDRVTKLDDIYCKYLLPYDTLSPNERQKLFDEVDLDWAKHESKLINDIQDQSDDYEDYLDEIDAVECITKGRNMALNAFYRIARNTMSMYFKTTEPPPEEVENEFWKYVNNRQNHICVHSGSIDSGSWGYGFCCNKNSPFARHPWNLKILTNNSGSVLRSMGPVMGVTVPTLHVGMIFSACCWYRDPHGLPWIEYLHTGSPKIWYGVPDSYSETFQGALKKLVPNFIQNKTLWLPSDTAMVPPNLLTQNGVSLCRTVQEPGQFIVVFPKAFTSTICTGYTVSESVYFAAKNWLETAKNVFKDIQESCEPSMFSYERLLISIASDQRSNPEVLTQILPDIEALIGHEKMQRAKLEKLGLTTLERLPLPETGGKKKKKLQEDDGEYECEVCRANLFVSMVTNTQEDGIYCLDHAVEYLEKKPAQIKNCKLLFTHNLKELDGLIDKIKNNIEHKSQKGQKNTGKYAGMATLLK